MTVFSDLQLLKSFAQKELYENILPFWRSKTIDHEQGGFFAEISSDLKVNTNAPKGLILNARILWTFSAAYSVTKNEEDLQIAERAFEYICNQFYDKEFEGYFWSVNSDGSPNETKKQVYALAFVMYGMSEYYKITMDDKALKRAKDLFYLLEEKSFDKEKNGYFEAYAQDWSELEDIRLSEKEMNEAKTMNTHLHVIEAYANLYLVWKDEYLAVQLENLVNIFLENIFSPEDNHLNLFFDEDWNVKSTEISFGHDIEASWLIHESALIHGSGELIKRVEEKLSLITDAAMIGLTDLGGIYHENDRAGKHIDLEYEWWPQAEALVGFLNTYQVTKHKDYIRKAVKIKDFIERYMSDSELGEWHTRVNPEGQPIMTHNKMGFWKCPYHNGRACLELIRRVNQLESL